MKHRLVGVALVLFGTLAASGAGAQVHKRAVPHAPRKKESQAARRKQAEARRKEAEAARQAEAAEAARRAEAAEATQRAEAEAARQREAEAARRAEAEATRKKNAEAAPRTPPQQPATPEAPASEVQPWRRTISVSVAPEWGYRSFVDREPSSVDKDYKASGVLGLRVHGEVYPLAPLRTRIPNLLRDIGLIGTYARAFGLQSTDNDKVPPPPEVIDTEWYHYLIGLRFRPLGDRRPIALGFSAAYERWVFDFEIPAPQRRLVPTARYSLLPIGVDARWSIGRFAVFGEARFLALLAKAPLGDRTPSPGGFGGQAEVGLAFAFIQALQVDARATYTQVRFSLPPLPGRADQRGTVLDHYLVFSAGATVQF